MKTPQRFSFRVLTAEKKCRRFLGRLAIFFVEHRSTLQKTVSVKIYFLFFWEFECNFSVFCKNKLSEVARFSFYVSRKKFFLLKKCIKRHKFSSFLVPTAKKCLRKKIGRLVKSVLVLSTVLFPGKLVFWSFFFLSGSLSVNFLLFCKTKLALMSKDLFLSPQDSFGKKNCFLKFRKIFIVLVLRTKCS